MHSVNTIQSKHCTGTEEPRYSPICVSL